MKALGLMALCTLALLFLTQSCSRPSSDDLNPPPPSTQDTIPQTPDPGTPVVVDSAVTIYSCTWDTLYAFNAWDGSKKWAKAITGLQYESISYGEGSLYITLQNKGFVAVDTTGQIRWMKTLDGYPGSHSAVVHNGIVYINDSHGNIYALDAISGNIKWQLKTSDDSYGNLVLRDNVIYCNAYYLYAINALTGQVIWSTYTGGFVQPVVSINKVYANGVDKYNYNSELKVFDRATGGIIQHIDPGHIISMEAANGYMYCMFAGLGGRNSGDMSAFDTTDLSIKWTIPASLSSVILVDSNLIFNKFGVITFYDAYSGKLSWEWKGSNAQKVNFGNNIIYFSSKKSDSYLYLHVIGAFDRATNTVKWISKPISGETSIGFRVVTKFDKMLSNELSSPF